MTLFELQMKNIGNKKNQKERKIRTSIDEKRNQPREKKLVFICIVSSANLALKTIT